MSDPAKSPDEIVIPHWSKRSCWLSMVNAKVGTDGAIEVVPCLGVSCMAFARKTHSSVDPATGKTKVLGVDGVCNAVAVSDSIGALQTLVLQIAQAGMPAPQIEVPAGRTPRQ